MSRRNDAQTQTPVGARQVGRFAGKVAFVAGAGGGVGRRWSPPARRRRGLVLTARLHDTATARDLAAQLPLTLTLRDLNGVEKTAPLPRRLSLDGAPRSGGRRHRLLGPEGDLVFYYGDVEFWTGIVRIGHFDGEFNAIERQRQDFDATVERA